MARCRDACKRAAPAPRWRQPEVRQEKKRNWLDFVDPINKNALCCSVSQLAGRVARTEQSTHVLLEEALTLQSDIDRAFQVSLSPPQTTKSLTRLVVTDKSTRNLHRDEQHEHGLLRVLHAHTLLCVL